MLNRRSLGFALAFGFALVASPAMAAEKVTIFAAASLKNALDGVSAAWTKATGKEAAISYAASSALARQIEQGAPADIYFSADLDWMKYLADRKLVPAASEVRLLGNEIVLIAPKDSPASISIVNGFDLASLVGEGRLAMADVKAVPAGKYGKASLEALGVWGSVEGKIAQAENVRAALKLVAAGEAPLGIVYRTDALAEPSVKIIGTFPAGSHPPIIYPVSVTTEAKSADAAAFVTFLQSDPARAIFEAEGFTVLTPPATN